LCDQETSKTRRLKAHYRAVKIQLQWVVTPGKQTTTNKLAHIISASKAEIATSNNPTLNHSLTTERISWLIMCRWKTITLQETWQRFGPDTEGKEIDDLARRRGGGAAARGTKFRPIVIIGDQEESRIFCRFLHIMS
jgi:hypothetical protein